MSGLLLIVGLILLVAGAEALVRGASRLATAWGIPPLVVGLTVVAYGTSTPEMAVSVVSGLAGRADLALGNVVGSNVFNVLLILGLSAVVTPLVVSARLVRLDVPLMIGVSFLPVLLGLDGRIGRLEGLLLLAGAAAYTTFLIRSSRQKDAAGERQLEEPSVDAAPGAVASTPRDVALVVLGLALLVVGSRLLVDGAVAIARGLGLSELVIGLTLVAAGTSMPEVATSVIASLRGERDIAVGNVVGSNLFNILAVLGLSAAATPGGVGVPEAALRFDLPVMVAVAVACLPIFFTGHRIDRWEGALFLAYYVAYTAYLLLAASGHPALRALQFAMAGFVLPLTGLTLAVIAVRAWRRER